MFRALVLPHKGSHGRILQNERKEVHFFIYVQATGSCRCRAPPPPPHFRSFSELVREKTNPPPQIHRSFFFVCFVEIPGEEKREKREKSEGKQRRESQTAHKRGARALSFLRRPAQGRERGRWRQG